MLITGNPRPLVGRHDHGFVDLCQAACRESGDDRGQRLPARRGELLRATMHSGMQVDSCSHSAYLNHWRCRASPVAVPGGSRARPCAVGEHHRVHIDDVIQAARIVAMLSPVPGRFTTTATGTGRRSRCSRPLSQPASRWPPDRSRPPHPRTIRIRTFLIPYRSATTSATSSTPAAWTGQYAVIVSPWGTANLYCPGYGHAPPSWTQVDHFGANRYAFRSTPVGRYASVVRDGPHTVVVRAVPSTAVIMEHNASGSWLVRAVG